MKNSKMRPYEITDEQIAMIAGGMPDGADSDRIWAVTAYVDTLLDNPNFEQLSARMRDMNCDSNVWTYDAVIAELQAIDPAFRFTA